MPSEWAAYYDQRFAEVNNVRIYYIDAPAKTTQTKGILLLIHGFPQTSYQYRYVIAPLTEAGYRVIVPDYRGAGRSSKPIDGLFTKTSIAKDLHELVFTHLSIAARIHIVGHDIGGMIAHALASRWPDDVISIVWGECPLPGTAAYEANKAAQSQFHFVFHAVHSLPEALVAGKERVYIKHFLDNKCANAGAFSDDDVSVYTEAYSQAGAMRCAFGLYRAFETDKQENSEWKEKYRKCKVPALGLSGDESAHRLEAKDMVEEMYENVEVAEIERSGHYVAEENPEDFARKVIAFVEKHHPNE
ncbi:MAG: hypothetical protein M1822_002114 [Bathelium mastoideum]|nr:MAG: hypothetical protein M1822_002114 [Bathelium mastoideum]